ncbi:MAG: YhbY family RNA-binding protein [Betaproteobacteria bacterium]
MVQTSPTPLSAENRRALKARAHHIEPVVIIGDAGLTPAVLSEIEVHFDLT